MSEPEPARAPAPEAGRVWVVSELYYPEETSTGYVLTEIAEGLAAVFDVQVLCSQPTYSARGRRAPAREVHHGVRIIRAWTTTLDKDVLPFRLINMATISLSIFLHACLRFSRGDIVVVATNPPVLPFLMAVAGRLRRARTMLVVHDVYPEVVVAAGLAQPDAWTTRLLGRLTRVLYRHMDRITVLGRDMAALVRSKIPAALADRVVIIPNWAAEDLFAPRPRAANPLLAELGLLDRFVVQYAGNMGRAHGIETLCAAAAQLQEVNPSVHFLFIGSGAKKRWLEQEAARLGLRNLTILPPRPRTDQAVFLNACDVAINAFVDGMKGVGVPSRTYNVLAVGKPIIGAVEADSELGLVVNEEQVGWIVPPGDVAGVVHAIEDAAADPARLAAMGARARAAARTKYTLDASIDAYRRAVRELRDASA